MTTTQPIDPPVETVDTIVLLSVDSLRLDRVHAHRQGVPLTPTLDTLAEESLEFEEGIAPGPGTADSVPSMLTGAYPSQFPGFSLPDPGTEPLTLAERVSEKGFECAAFHQNNLLSRRYNFDRGFDHYYDISGETRDESGRGRWRLAVRNAIEDTPLMSAARWLQTQLMETVGKSLYVLDEPGDSLTDRALEWLDDTGESRFLWLHYMDSHHPYLSPPGVQREFGEEIPRAEALQLSRKARSDDESLTDDEVKRLEYAYDCSVRFVDQQIGRVIDHLELRGNLNDAMVIVTADHGEEFLEHGAFGHRDALWDELIRVPLIIRHPTVDSQYVPGQGPVQRITETVVDGRGVFALRDAGAEYVVSETRAGQDGVRCCRGHGFKLIDDGDELTVTRVNQGDEMIVTESDVDGDVFAEMERRLQETRERYIGEAIDRDALEADLEALGYLDE